MKKSMLLKVALLIAMCVPVQSMAAVYRLTLLDTTGSMTEGTKWDDAKVVVGQMLTTNPGGWDALWQIHGADSGVVAGFDFTKTVLDTTTGTFVPDVAQNIIDKINSGDLDPVVGPNTPLADMLCNAMAALENVAPAAGNDKHLYLITDGDENSSGYYADLVSECATDISLYINGLPFTPLATDIYPSQVVSVDDTDRSWIKAQTTFPDQIDPVTNVDLTGRAYNPPGVSDLFDWSAGVIQGSWEWRMYYRAARTNIPSTPVNADWPLSAVDVPSDVIFNVVSFYTDVTPATTALKTLSPAAGGAVSPSEYLPMKRTVGARLMTAAAMAPASVVSYNQGQLDAFTFAGLAQLSGGNYVPVVAGEPLPIIGDLNDDGLVDETDLRMVITWFGRPVDTYNQPSIDADLFGDSFINNADIEVVRHNWSDINKYPPIIGDTDFNWCVDQSDLNKIWQWYGRTPGAGDQAFYYADLNADGVVDEDDVDLYDAHAGEGCGSNGIPTCNDGIQYGEETDVDCGGPICNGCDDGQVCEIADDCLSNVCLDGICDGGAPSGDVDAVVNVTQNWGSGYCATINVTNNAGSATTGWSVELAMNGSMIYTSWNGVFSGSTVTNVGWNGVVNPGQTINSTGFCANLNGGAMATVVSASGTF